MDTKTSMFMLRIMERFQALIIAESHNLSDIMPIQNEQLRQSLLVDSAFQYPQLR